MGLWHFAEASLKQSAQVQYNCNTSFFTTAASFLQVVENLYCSIVLQGSTQVQYNCNTCKNSCTVVVLHLCGLLKAASLPDKWRHHLKERVH